MKKKALLRAKEAEKQQRLTPPEHTPESKRPTSQKSSVHKAAEYASGGGRPTATTLRALQRTVGNTQVRRALGSQKEEGDQAYPGLAEELDRERGSGQPLPSEVRERMERAFGDDHDFSGVRVHTDPKANALNRQLSARAFTAGRDVFFREGEFAPDTAAGRKLLAHELAHVVQQSQGAVESATSSGNQAVVGAPDDAFEKAADRVAETVSSGNTLSPAQAAPGVQRQVEPEEEEEEEEVQDEEEEEEEVEKQEKEREKKEDEEEE